MKTLTTELSSSLFLLKLVFFTWVLGLYRRLLEGRIDPEAFDEALSHKLDCLAVLLDG